MSLMNVLPKEGVNEDNADEDVPDPEGCLVVDVIRQNAGWAQNEITYAANAARMAFQKSKTMKRAVGEAISIALVFADDAFVKNLNMQFRQTSRATNVLAFPADLPTLLGDVVIAHATALAEAREKNIPLADHIAHLAAHGTLHLLGFTHNEEDDAEIMEALEINVLKAIGVANPYQGDEADHVGE